MKVILNKYGYYELAEKPSESELNDYYSKKYYQENKLGYQKTYDDEELTYINNKVEQKKYVLETEFKIGKGKLLDIGSGEGWVLSFFKERDWEVMGMDYSEYGCKMLNPHCVGDMLIGDIYFNLEKLGRDTKRYDVIWLDNVLEHVLDPSKLLSYCRKLINANGVLIVEVPNDFSRLQKYLLAKNYIQNEFWIAIPDHISYFNTEGLTKIANEANFNLTFAMSDFPIDFSLVNPDTNYVVDKTKGKNCNKTRIEIDNFMHSISVSQTVNYYKSLADMGLGRQIIGFFTPV